MAFLRVYFSTIAQGSVEPRQPWCQAAQLERQQHNLWLFRAPSCESNARNRRGGLQAAAVSVIDFADAVLEDDDPGVAIDKHHDQHLVDVQRAVSTPACTRSFANL